VFLLLPFLAPEKSMKFCEHEFQQQKDKRDYLIKPEKAVALYHVALLRSITLIAFCCG